jgi:hypothetical protein
MEMDSGSGLTVLGSGARAEDGTKDREGVPGRVFIGVTLRE